LKFVFLNKNILLFVLDGGIPMKISGETFEVCVVDKFDCWHWTHNSKEPLYKYTK